MPPHRLRRAEGPSVSGKALAILGISLSAVIIATLLLFVIVNRGGQVQTKDRENAEQAAQFNDTLSKLRNDIAALRSDLSKKADADNSISKEQFSRGTRGFVTKDALAGYSTALDLR